MSGPNQPMQRGPNTHKMDAPSDVTTWHVIHTVRNVVNDDGKGMTLRDEWWEIPSFVVEEIAPASPEPTPGLREALRIAHAELEDAREWLASRAEAPEVQERLTVARNALVPFLAAPPAPEPTGLDAAWAEAEAAMPGLEVGRLRMLRLPTHREPIWQAEGLLPTGGVASGEGPTPAAALRALAARLTGEGS